MLNKLGDSQWLVYVLPGFLALFTASFISDFPHIRDVQLPIVYVALTVMSLVIPLGFVHIYGRIAGKGFDLERTVRKSSFLCSVFLCSIILGFLFGIAHTTNYVSNALRYAFGKDIILTSSHNELVRTLFQTSYREDFLDGHPHITDERKRWANRYAIFRFKEDEREYEGVIASFFGGQDRPQVYLTPACIVSGGRTEPIKGPGVWLDLAAVRDIQFIYDVCSQCADQLELSAGQDISNECPFES